MSLQGAYEARHKDTHKHIRTHTIASASYKCDCVLPREHSQHRRKRRSAGCLCSTKTASHGEALLFGPGSPAVHCSHHGESTRCLGESLSCHRVSDNCAVKSGCNL